MINIYFMAYYSGLGGGAIGDLLARWEQAGVFNYVLPFLLIFALVFGILSKMSLFGENSKGINAVLALAVGLMALQFNFVGTFFAEIFPRLGVGLSIILAVMVLIGLFAPQGEKGKPGLFQNIMLGVAIIVAIVVVAQSYGAFGWYSGYNLNYWIMENWPTVLGILIFLGALVGIIGIGNKSPKVKGKIV